MNRQPWPQGSVPAGQSEEKDNGSAFQSRYEDSKKQFQEFLHRVLCKYQEQINFKGITGSQQAGAGRNGMKVDNYAAGANRSLVQSKLPMNGKRPGVGANGAQGTIQSDKLGTSVGRAPGRPANGQTGASQN